MSGRTGVFFAALVALAVGVAGSSVEGIVQERPGFSQHSRALTDGWEFARKDIGGWWELWRIASHSIEWSKVQLPHCYNAYDAVDPDVEYYQGPAWYRIRLRVENPYHQGRTLLHFEGAGQKTQVWVYDRQVATHVGGYDEFVVDITEAVEEFRSQRAFAEDAKDRISLKGVVPIGIRCDNSRDLEMIPSDLSDFNVYGGLYRDVNLVYVPAVSLERVHVKTTRGADGRWLVEVLGELHNPEKRLEVVSTEVEVVDPLGERVFLVDGRCEAWPGSKVLWAGTIEQGHLWSPREPQLYRCIVRLKSPGGEQVVNERFGLRWFEFVKKGPFKLNGERLLLRGTHRHEDHAGLGAAMTDALMGREMRMMKEMGVNFLRLGHYQQSRRILELCDELGILVWEEIPWCRGGLGGEGYRGQARRMLANMIGQHYNHACVILWGLGNENDWSGDFPTFDKQAIREFMRELHDLAHQLDGQRKTCIRRCGFCSDIVDVYSPSIWAGWYRGKFTEYKDVSWQEMQKVDHFLHVEWGASHHALRHSEDPDKGLSRIKAGQGADERAGDYLLSGGEARVSRDSDWTETYACNLIDWHLKEQETMDWLTGAAYWPFKDFSTPVRPENPVPYMNQKGVVQRDLTAKETYYVFQSYWAEEAMVHIYGHTWPVRWGEPNEAKMFKVYSNCAEVELLLDGRSLGTRRRDSQDYPAAGLRWVTPLQAGMHRLVAVGCGEQGEVVDEITFRYEDRQWGPPAKLMLQEVAREEGITTVEALLTDAAGVICLDATKVVRFDLAGDGALIDNLGIVQAAREVQLCNGRARIQVRHDGGRLVASVSCERVPTAFISLEGGMSGSGNEP